MAIVKSSTSKNQNKSKLPRKEITSILTNACIDYYTHKRYGVYKEIGVIRWGNLRADLFAFSLKGEFIGIEVKSCKADFDSDFKLGSYLQYFDKFYICCPPDIVEYIKEQLKYIDKDIGIFTLASDGYLVCMKWANRLKGPSEDERKRLLLKLAWRGADYSKRNRPRRKRWYIS